MVTKIATATTTTKSQASTFLSNAVKPLQQLQFDKLYYVDCVTSGLARARLVHEGLTHLIGWHDMVIL